MSKTRRRNPYEYSTDYYKESGDCDHIGNPHHRDGKQRTSSTNNKLRRKGRRAKEKSAWQRTQ